MNRISMLAEILSQNPADAFARYGLAMAYAAEGPASETILRKYENLIKTSDVFNDVATLRQQLVILGTPKTVREWRYYAYENDGFVLMLPN